MGREKDLKLRRQFEQVDEKQRCRHCATLIGNHGGSMNRHLAKCKPFAKYQETNKTPEDRVPRPTQSLGIAGAAHRRPTKNQEHEISKQFSKAALISSVGLNFYENNEFKKGVHMLNQYYSPPSRSQIVDGFLPELYEDYRQMVKTMIDLAEHITIIVDASEDETADNLFNISVQLPNCAVFYWQTIDIGAPGMAPGNPWEILIPILHELVGQDLRRIVALCTDTCETLHAMHNLFHQDAKTNHIWVVLCDSHSLQLVVESIINEEPFKYTVENVDMMVSFFCTSKLQFDRLRQCQKTRRPFLFAGINCWGTHHRSAMSIASSRDDLIQFTFREDVRAEVEALRQSSGLEHSELLQVVDLIQNNEFWKSLDGWLQVLKPLHEAIVSAEKDRQHVGQVLNRLTDVENAWRALSRNDYYNWINFNRLIEILHLRKSDQTSAINYVAWALDSTTVDTPLEPNEEALISSWLYAHGELLLPGQGSDIVRVFGEYRNHQNNFAPPTFIYLNVKQPLDLWKKVAAWGCPLGHLAIRLFAVNGNSAPSERSYGANGQVHNPEKNHLDFEKANKLKFITMNSHVLDRDDTVNRDPVKHWDNLPNAKVEELDDALYGQLE